MDLDRAHFDLPRAYATGALSGTIEASTCLVLRYDGGAIYVQRQGGPLTGYTLGAKDWWVPTVPVAAPAPLAPEPPAAPPPPPTPNQPTNQTAHWKNKRR